MCVSRKTVALVALALPLIACLLTSVLLLIPRAGEDLLGPLFVLLLCALPAALFVISLVWIVRFNGRARRAAQTAAEQFGLASLSDSSDPLAAWYGGDYQGRDIALKLYGRRERSYSGNGYMISASFWLRIVMEVRLAAPLGRALEPGPGMPRGPVQTFAEAFDAPAADLAPAAQAALLDFVQRGYPTGLSGTTWRTSTGARSLALYDRAAVPERLGLPAFVLPDAAAVLIHDHQDTGLSQEALAALLDQLSAVAAALEAPDAVAH